MVGMEEEIQQQPTQAPTTHRLRTVVITLTLVMIAFGAGYVPKTLENRRLRASLAITTMDLKLANLHRQLGLASSEAQRNNYASAADAARTFFDGCRALAQEPAFAQQPRTREAIAAYAANADDIVSRLTAGDPGVKEKLIGLFVAMDGVLQRRL